ncbi:MAG: phosphatase PAP2 family protein [Sphingobacteriia bacterium]|nr:phosphatase PAP2 family protein [Sphingobacteriia bacterium]NCC40011.1 phosphatase PAP2 family protein [Gammaproteobacteria bacterium]
MNRADLDRWQRQLAARLAIGAARTPLTSPSGAVWLSRWAWVCLIVAVTLFLCGGYEAGFTRINGATAAAPDWVWAGLTVLGDERVVLALALIIALRYPRLFWALILAALIAIAYGRGFKVLFDTTRPPGVLPAETFNLIGPGHRRHSFPSGHSVAAGVFFGILIYYAHHPLSRALYLTLAVLAGISRVAVGVHWPLDVAAGLLGGALAALIGAHWAARWPGPATHPRLHLALVGVAVIAAIQLLFDDGGYESAGLALILLGLLALATAIIQYLIRPWLENRDET